jgi:putative ABC transport system ATP-binding protein
MRMSDTDYLFLLKNIRKSYYSETDVQIALDVKELAIPRGGVTAILGNSGSGKSTLLNILSMLDKPDEHGIENGASENLKPEIHTSCFSHHGYQSVNILERENEFASVKRDTFGFVFQQGYLLENLPGKWNIQVPLDVAGVEVDGVELREFSESVKLFDNQDERLPSAISGGEAQRIAVARSIVHSPKVVIADEPSSSLDPVIGGEILNLLTDWCREDDSRSLIWVTHNVGQAAKLADNIIIMSNGRPSEVRSNPRDAAVLLSWMQDLENNSISNDVGESAEDSTESLLRPDIETLAGPTDKTDIWKHSRRKPISNPVTGLVSFVLRMAVNDVFPLAGSGNNGMASKIFNRRSAQTLNILALFMIMSLANFLLSVHFSLYNYFVESQTDPRINNIRVLGKLKDSDSTLSKADIAKLRSLVWASPPNSFEKFVVTRKVARRKNFDIEKSAVIDVRGARRRPMDFYYEPDSARFSPTESIEVVTLNPDDPILETIARLGGTDVRNMKETGETLGHVFRTAMRGSDKSKLNGVVVRRKKLLKDLGYKTVPKNLEIQLGGDDGIVPLLAVVDWLPFHGSMLMTNDWYDKLFMSRGSSDNLPGYEYVTVYIDHPLRDGLAISNAIHEIGYMMADDVRSKLSWISDLTNFVLFFSMVALVGVAVVVCMTLFVSFSDTIKKRQKEIGVLIAFGISSFRLNSVFVFEALIVWFAAVVLLIPAGYGIQFILKYSMGNTLRIEPEKLERIVSIPVFAWLAVVAVAFVIAVMAALFAVRTISRLNVANILRES